MIPARTSWLFCAVLFTGSTSITLSFVHPNSQFARPPSSLYMTATTSTTTSTKNEKTIDKKLLLNQLPKCKSGSRAKQVLEKALIVPNNSNDDTSSNNNNNNNSSNQPLYGSLSIPGGASERPLSDADLAIQTNIRNQKYSIMELIELNGDKDADRASLALLCLFTSSSVSALVAQQNLPGPEIVRFAVVWLLCFSPFVFIGYGISTPDKLQSILVSIQRNVFPTYRKRMLQHEAGHLLIGHLLGYPVKGYRANAVKNAVEFYPLNDGDVGKDRASLLGFDRKDDNDDNVSSENDNDAWRGGEPKEDAPFFSEGGRGDEMLQNSVFRESSKKDYRNNPFLKLPIENDPTKSWPYRGFNHATLDQLTAISVAGVCSEILAFGNAEGGYADFSQLRQLMNSATPEVKDEKEVDNRIRYALGFTMGQLRRHLGVLDVLVEAMEEGKDVAECVLLMEECMNVSGANVMNNYEQLRREKIQNEGVNAIEKWLLGGGRNMDDEDRTVVEGKGGGDRKEVFRLTGDDPLYLALGTAALFVVWASAGGLTLH